MDIFKLEELARLLPEVAIVFVFIWYLKVNHESNLALQKSQQEMYMKLITSMDENNRNALLTESRAFRDTLRGENEAFRSTLETLAREWGKQLEALTIEVKTLTRFITYLAGRLGMPSLEEEDDEDRPIKKARH